MVDRKLQVFISSTYTDLMEERQAALESVLKTGNIPSGMEFFNSDGRDTLDIIYNWIDDSDIFVLILGGRYGLLESTSQKSFTHLEYEYAKRNNKSIIAVILSDKFIENKVKEVGTSVIERDNTPKYNEFKKMVKDTGMHCIFCDDLKDIRHNLSISISATEKINTFTGWVSGKEFEKLQSENSRLQIENNKLKRDIENYDRISTKPYVAEKQNQKYAFVSEGIDIQLHSIKQMDFGFQLHFTVKNNSSRKLMDYGRFSFKVTPQKYEEEINTIGYSMIPTNGLTSQFIYPNESFAGYYEWHTKLNFKLDEIQYAVLINGQYRDVATWYPTDVKKLI